MTTNEEAPPTTRERLRDAETEVELLWRFAISLLNRIEVLEGMHQ